MASIEEMKGSRLKCAMDVSPTELFFSLTDYRNNIFLSENSKDILEFFNGFEDRDHLIEWMKERPKGTATVHEVEGNKSIIVVIPTADFNGRYAKECRENIFKGFHIIFVESGEFPDPYFNYAQNCNLGIKVAMKYNPKWIVISNDDMEVAEPIEKLKEELDRINAPSGWIVLAKGKGFHSKTIKIGYRTKFIRLLKFSKKYSRILNFEKSIEIKYGQLLGIDGYYSIHTIFTKSVYKIHNVGSFFIFSPKILMKYKGILFDETYINGYEDVDFSINESSNKVIFTDYRINDIGGATLGSLNSIRSIRDIINKIYITYKFEKGLFKNFGKKQ